MMANTRTENGGRPRAPLADIARRNGALGIITLRVALGAILMVLQPLLSIGLLALTCVCLALCLFSLTFPPGTHFPGFLIAVIGLLSALLNYGYSALVQVILPDVGSTLSGRR
jgi:hypothetical protein